MKNTKRNRKRICRDSLLRASDSALEKLGKPSAEEPGDGDELATPADATPEMDLLRTEQRFVLEDLMTGMSPADVARKNLIDRKTLYLWINRDPVFKSALAACHRQATQLARDRLRLGVAAAAVTLTEAATTDSRAAAVLLKGFGLLPGPRLPLILPPALLPALRSLPPARRQEFEVRLLELIVSFKEEPPEKKAAPQIEHHPEEASDEEAGPIEKTGLRNDHSSGRNISRSS